MSLLNFKKKNNLYPFTSLFFIELTKPIVASAVTACIVLAIIGLAPPILLGMPATTFLVISASVLACVYAVMCCEAHKHSKTLGRNEFMNQAFIEKQKQTVYYISEIPYTDVIQLQLPEDIKCDCVLISDSGKKVATLVYEDVHALHKLKEYRNLDKPEIGRKEFTKDFFLGNGIEIGNRIKRDNVTIRYASTVNIQKITIQELSGGSQASLFA